MAKEYKTEIEKRKSTPAVSNMGKLPPQDIEVEKKILGTIIQSPKSIVSVIDLFKPEIFYVESHQKIASSILNLHSRNVHIDMSTVADDLRKNGFLEIVGGMYYVIELTNFAVYEGLRDNMKIISQKYLSRELIRISSESTSNGYNDTDDVFESISLAINNLSALQQGTMETTEVTMEQLSFQSMKERDELKGKTKEILGYKTGYRLLDKQTLGIKTGELTIIAARPAMGKTAMGVNLAYNIADLNNVPVAIVSLEMKNGKLYVRFQANLSGINSNDINLNKLTTDERVELLKADTKLSKMPIIMNDASYMHADELRAKVIMWCHKYGIKVVVADYLGLFDGTGFSQELKVGYISRTMKKIAMELDVAMIALAQLSRKVEERAGKMPQLSDLRDSGSIEQDADNVWFLYRPEYYKIDYPIEFDEFGLKIMPSKLLVIIVAKQREGETGNIPLLIELSKMRISDHPSTVSQIPPPDKKNKSVQTTMDINPNDQSSDEPF